MKQLLRLAILALAVLLAIPGVFGAELPAVPANVLVPELMTLEDSYAKSLREQVEEPQQAALRRLTESYRVTLETTFKKSAAQGLLDESVALQAEEKRFFTEPRVPDTDEPGLHPAVAKLRSSWRAEVARIAAARDKALQPLRAAQLANLRTLERELTKALRIDEARAVRAKADAMTAPADATAGSGTAPVAAVAAVPAVVPLALPAAGNALPAPGARPAERVDLFAVGIGECPVFVNDREAIKKTIPLNVAKARVGLKEGDIIAIKNPNTHYQDNSVYLAATAASGEFLFETTNDWHSYIPKNHDKWWDTKNIQGEENAQYLEKNQWLHRLVRAATWIPYYRGAWPIHNAIRDEQVKGCPTYCYHVVSRQDLLPKKRTLAPVPALALAAQYVGKTIRIKTAKDGGEWVSGNEQLIAGPLEAKTPMAGAFKVGKGPEPGNVTFESREKPGFFIRTVNYKLQLVKGGARDGYFELTPPVHGNEGVSVISIPHLEYYWSVGAKGDLGCTGSIPPSAVFFFEEIAVK